MNLNRCIIYIMYIRTAPLCFVRGHFEIKYYLCSFCLDPLPDTPIGLPHCAHSVRFALLVRSSTNFFIHFLIYNSGFFVMQAFPCPPIRLYGYILNS